MNRALLIVDVQNDFCPGGSMGVEGGHAVAAKIAEYARANKDAYDLIVFSKDWHEADSTNGGHIALPPEEPDFVDTWPVHCIQGTHGAELHPDMQALADELKDKTVVLKGMGVPAYSAFEGFENGGDRRLIDVLAPRVITDIDVVGIATDHCVKASVMDALKVEFTVNVLSDMCAGVAPDTSLQALEDMTAGGAQVTTSDA